MTPEPSALPAAAARASYVSPALGRGFSAVDEVTFRVTSTVYLGASAVTTVDSQKRCAVCGGGLPEVSLLMRDPFCSRACSQEHHGTGSRADRERDSRRRLDSQLESGTDAASMELRRITVDERTTLIAEGRFWEEYLRAYAAYLVAHKPPATTPTVTWFSYRSSGPTMREFDPEDEPY